MVVVVVVVAAGVVVVVRNKKFECDDARGTRAEQHARNPRQKQTRITRGTCAKRRRAEPAQNADARNPRVLLILSVVVVIVVVVVVLVVVVVIIS